MSEYVFDTILQEWTENEWGGYADVPEFKTSKKHDRAMKRIFKLYSKNTRHLRSQSDIRITIRRRLVVALLVIILAVITGFTAAYFVSRGFHGEVHHDNTELFPIDTENCPTVIEYEYYLTGIPEEYEVISTGSDQFSRNTIYENKRTGQMITFEQWVKSEFDSIHFNTAKGEIVEVDINGHYGVYIDLSNNALKSTHVMWDNEDYIIILSSDMPKNSLLDLAKSAKVL